MKVEHGEVDMTLDLLNPLGSDIIPKEVMKRTRKAIKTRSHIRSRNLVLFQKHLCMEVASFTNPLAVFMCQILCWLHFQISVTTCAVMQVMLKELP